jgi:hypothetical protein
MAEPPEGGQARLRRHEAGEVDQANITCPTQGNLKPDSEPARSGGHEAGEGEKGGGARRGGAPLQEEMGRRGTGFQRDPAVASPE